MKRNNRIRRFAVPATVLCIFLCFGLPNPLVTDLPAGALEAAGILPDSMPASPELFTWHQPDGATFRARLRGDEWYHWMETEAGYTVEQNPKTGYYEYQLTDAGGHFISSGVRAGVDDPVSYGIPRGVRENISVIRERVGARQRATMAEAPLPQKSEKVSTTGTVKKLVILANFSDTSTTYSQSQFDALFNQHNYTNAGLGISGSVWDYYQENSYGNLDLQTTVSVWVTLPRTSAFYGTNEWTYTWIDGRYIAPAQLMVEEAIDALNATGFDFSPFDTDHDGWIDAFAVIHQGFGEEAGGGAATIWSHKWGINTKTVDGIMISTYYTAPERYSSYISTIGVYCHEFGHSLGLPDLYDTDYTSEGVGNWCLMSGGSWNGSPGGNRPAHMLAWCKSKLGWITPTVISASASDLPLNRLSDNTEAYKLTYGMPGSNEYYLIENRQKTGFDNYLPGSGLIVTHIDENKGSNTQEDGTSSLHYKVAVLQADGLRNFENGTNRGDSGDPFPGFSANRAINPTTNPSSDRWDGADSNIYLFDISNSGNTMTFSVSLGGPPAGSLQVTISPQAAIDAGAKWRRNGTTTWHDSGYTENNLPVDTVLVDFLDTSTWAKPSSVFVSIVNADTATTTGTYTLKTGSLKVNITPAAAVSAGAQWRRTGTSTWMNSGATESGLAVGDYSVEFKSVTDWNEPANMAATVSYNTTTTKNAVYTAPPGTLTVTLSPQAAIDAGAQWRRTGTATWYNSGATESNVAVGDHTIEFKDTTTWAPPSNASVTINSNADTSTSGTYTEKTGSLTVNISPAGAVSGGGQWRRSGTSTWLDSGATESGLPVGSYTLEYSAVSNFDAPTDTSTSVSWNTTTTVNAAYTPHTGSVLVTILPAEAVTAGAQWRRVGQSTWQNSGTAETGIFVGDYDIEFKVVTGWDTPANESVTVTKDTESGAGGTYVQQFGTLTVIIGPPEAVTAGAAWRRTGTTTWFDSGDTEDPVPAGGVTIEFKAVDGWGQPSNMADTVVKDTLTTVSATYVECVKNFDVNKDGSVTPGDALMVFKHYLGIALITDACSLIRADANSDGSITPGDALVIFKAYLGIE